MQHPDSRDNAFTRLYRSDHGECPYCGGPVGNESGYCLDCGKLKPMSYMDILMGLALLAIPVLIFVQVLVLNYWK